MYILRLVTEVEWTKEKQFFETFSRETATFYAQPTLINSESEWKWFAEYILYDNIKRFVMPSNQLESAIVAVANLQNFYKVFERC